MSHSPKQDNYPKHLASVIVPWWDHSELLDLWELNLAHLQKSTRKAGKKTVGSSIALYSLSNCFRP